LKLIKPACGLRLTAYSLIVLSCLLLAVSQVEAKEYDGIWFLGFNVRQSPFDNAKVRQAVAHCLDVNAVRGMIGEENDTGNFVPPGMPGYAPELDPYKLDLPYAKTLMKTARYPLNHPRLKNLALLHTDGVKTVEIAKKIQKDLRQIGMRVTLIQVSFRDEEKWHRQLASNEYPLFLMGYKAESVFTEEAISKPADSVQLLEPLFKTGGEANFFGYSNPTADMLFDQLSVISPTLLREREIKLKEINRVLYKELPAIVLFYIEKL